MTVEALFGTRTAEVLPDAITPALADEVRARLERLSYQRYALVDRGSYDVVPVVDEPALFAALVPLAERATQRTLAVAEARALRLGPGDYLLAHHDRPHDDLPIELVLDVSPAPVPGAELHYRRRGTVFFRMVAEPRALAIVERGPTVTCNHVYVSKRLTEASVVRLVLLLR